MLKAVDILTGVVMLCTFASTATAQTTKTSDWPPLLVCDAPKGKSYTVQNRNTLGQGDAGWTDDGYGYKSLALVQAGTDGWDMIFTLEDGSKESAKGWGSLTKLFASSHTVILIRQNVYGDEFYIYHFTRDYNDAFTSMYVSTGAGMPSKGTTSFTRPSSSLLVAQCR